MDQTQVERAHTVLQTALTSIIEDGWELEDVVKLLMTEQFALVSMATNLAPDEIAKGLNERINHLAMVIELRNIFVELVAEGGKVPGAKDMH